MKRNYSIIFFIAAISVSCASKSQIVSTPLPETKIKTPKRLSLQDSIINFGMNYLRTPYRYGGTTPSGFDCSGFTSYVYKNFGYDLGRSSRDQAVQHQTINRQDLQTGDLIFFEGRRHNGVVGHVGIVKDVKPNGEFNFIHSSVNNGVTISSSDEPYYASRFIKGTRVLDKANITFARQTKQSPLASAENMFENKNYATLPPSVTSKEAVYHIVKKGENLSKISLQYDVPISTVLHLNGLKSKHIKKGQKLLISEMVENQQIPMFNPPDITPNNEIIVNPSNTSLLTKTEIAPETPMLQPDKNLTLQDNQQTINDIPAVVYVDDFDASTQLKPQEKTVVRTMELKKPAQKETVQKIPEKPAATEGLTQPLRNSKTATHKVSAGESLFSIAKKYDISVDELKTINNLTSNNIQAGQLLSVGKDTNRATVQTEINKDKKSTKNIVHTVQKGETLYSIAKKYDCSVGDLKKWNENLNENIHAGDKITINNN